MRVTQIEELTRSRYKVYIDGAFAFVLYKRELRLYHIEPDAEIAGEDFDAIMKEVLPKRARLRAMNLLQRRDYTTAQLRTKLEQGLYPETVIDGALEYVASYRYTDDLRYAVQYIVFHEESRSRRRIEQDLAGKGISRETIQKAWSEWEDQGGVQDEEAQIRKLLAKRKYDPDTADYKETQKQAVFLMGKGFSSDKIHQVLREFL